MTSPTPPAPAADVHPYTPTLGSLFGAELLRVRSRRFLRWAVVGLLGVMVLVAVINFFQTAKPSQTEIDRALATCQTYSQDPDTGVESVERCETVREAAQQGGFDELPGLTSDVPDEVLGVGLGVAVLGFILGCTLGGADWSQKTMAALLFWEPRRPRVYLVKLAALLVTLVTILLVAQAVWIAIKTGLVAAHGVADVTAGSIVDDTLTNIGRSTVLVLAMGGLAYGLASLIRNTGAALGIGFVYFAIVELFINGLLPRLAPYTLTVNIGALFTPGGLREEFGNRVVEVSSLQAGLVLITYATVVCAIGLELFRRRDVT